MIDAINTMGAFLNVFDKAGKVLCVRQAYGHRMWTTPGGRLEAGETPLETALRETLEEVGLVIATASFSAIFWKTYAQDVVFSFTAAPADSHWHFVPNAEISEARFFHPDNLPAPMGFNTSLRIKVAAAPEIYTKRLFILNDAESYIEL